MLKCTHKIEKTYLFRQVKWAAEFSIFVQHSDPICLSVFGPVSYISFLSFDARKKKIGAFQIE